MVIKIKMMGENDLIIYINFFFFESNIIYFFLKCFWYYFWVFFGWENFNFEKGENFWEECDYGWV